MNDEERKALYAEKFDDDKKRYWCGDAGWKTMDEIDEANLNQAVSASEMYKKAQARITELEQKLENTVGRLGASEARIRELDKLLVDQGKRSEHLAGKLAVAEKALKKYGEHYKDPRRGTDSWCPRLRHQNNTCTCGFSEALATLEDSNE